MILEVRIVKELWVGILEVRILKGLGIGSSEARRGNCGMGQRHRGPEGEKE
jgi:hypothetical protein